MKSYPVISFILLLLLAAGIFLYSRNYEIVDNLALQIGNVGLWAITLISYLMISNSLKNPNPNAMVRAKMSGTILKFFAVILMVLTYIFVNHRQLPHKATIFVFLGLYVVYIGVEALFLANMAKNTNNNQTH